MIRYNDSIRISKNESNKMKNSTIFKGITKYLKNWNRKRKLKKNEEIKWIEQHCIQPNITR